MDFNKELCEERKKKVNDQFVDCAKRLDQHDQKIDSIEKIMYTYFERTDNVCKSVDGLVDSMKKQNVFIISTLITAISSIILFAGQFILQTVIK